jgi:hypothetical protein
MFDVLPECRTKVQRKVIRHANMNWVPLFCANCGSDGGMVPEEHCDFAFYLCMSCADKWGPITNCYMEPDHVFWEKVAQEQLDSYGRPLTAYEQSEVLKDDSSSLAKLAKDRPDFKTIQMT